MIPRVAILAVGDELLRGEIVDSNSSWLAGRLAELGVVLEQVRVVGDGLEAIASVVTELAAGRELLLVGGGLGPTDDDRTTEAVARALAVPLERDERALAQIEALFARLGLPCTANNAKQALVPRGGSALRNGCGTAPAISVRAGDCQIFCMPGVPRELRWVFDNHVAPWIASELDGRAARKRTIKLFGLGESQVDQQLRGLQQLLTAEHAACEISIHYRATFPEIHLVVLARPWEGEDEHAVDAALAAAESAVRAAFGRHVFGTDTDSFADAVVAALRDAGATVALAESCTGGQVGDLLTGASGSSEVFELGVVSYADRVKQEQLGVPAEVLATHGAVSEQCVAAMARGVRALAGASYGLAVSGIAGPTGGSADKPVGTVHFALASVDSLRHLHRVFPYDRSRNKQISAHVALWMLYRELRRGDGARTDGEDDLDPLAGRFAPAARPRARGSR